MARHSPFFACFYPSGRRDIDAKLSLFEGV
jgi:hypothetical protein